MVPSILIVDDEQAFVESAARMLRLEGYNDVTALTDPAEASRLVRERTFDVAMLDITMPEIDGLMLLGIIKQENPDTECIMVTANDAIQTVVTAVKRGAYDYVLKPMTPEQLACSLERALEHRRLLQSMRLRSGKGACKGPANREAFAEIKTVNTAMLRLLREAELHAGSNIPILVTGETGSGKELLARAVHLASRRNKGPFVPVNMLSLSPGLFESEFFGHAKGSFTGAERDKAGYLAQARSGTLFLDEIGDLSLEIQGKLLRVLQEGEFTPVGKTRSERADVRFVAATNRDLEALVAQNAFRKDLYYRLQFAHIHLPALRERIDDVPLLTQTLIGPRGASVTAEAAAILASHGWPGNVRELKGVLEAAANLAEGGPVGPSHLRLKLDPRPSDAPAPPSGGFGGTDWVTLDEAERRYVTQVLEHTSGRISGTAGAADLLGVKPSTLSFRINKLGLRDVLAKARAGTSAPSK
jgi:DNA-binding NtrC family response regulator